MRSGSKMGAISTVGAKADGLKPGSSSRFPSAEGWTLVKQAMREDSRLDAFGRKLGLLNESDQVIIIRNLLEGAGRHQRSVEVLSALLNAKILGKDRAAAILEELARSVVLESNVEIITMFLNSLHSPILMEASEDVRIALFSEII